MKKKIYLIINWNNKLEKLFLTKVSAQGWIKSYQNDIPKDSDRKYWSKYKIKEVWVNF